MKPAELHALYEAVLSRGGMLLINTLIPGDPQSTYVKISIPNQPGMVSRETYQADPQPRNWKAEVDLLRASYAGELDPIVVVQPQRGEVFEGKLEALLLEGGPITPGKIRKIIDDTKAEVPEQAAAAAPAAAKAAAPRVK